MKLLLKFFSNAANRAYLRGLATELGENTNAVRVELNRLSEAGLLETENQGNTIVYKANTHNPFYGELHRLVMKYLGVDSVVEEVVNKVGNIDAAFITGDYSQGLDTGIIDLVLVGEVFDKNYLSLLHRKAEDISKRKIRMLTLNRHEFGRLSPSLDIDRALVVWAGANSGWKVS